MTNVFAASSDIVGSVKTQIPSAYASVTGGGLILFITNIIRLLFVAAGIYAFVNLIIAGFQYMGAGGDTKQLTQAFGRIWGSLLGLIIVVGSFALAALSGYILFGDAGFILNPKIYGP